MDDTVNPNVPLTPSDGQKSPVKSTEVPAAKVEEKMLIDTSSAAGWDSTQASILELEEMLKSRVIVLYNNMNSYLTENDVEYLYDHVKNIGPTEKITMLLYGPGGSGVAAARIVYMVRKYCKQFEVIIPSMAASAMTMLSLGADKIWMGPLSSITPIDTSLTGHPLAPKDSKGYPVQIEVTQLQKYIELMNSGLSSQTVDDIKKSPYALLSEHVHPVVIGTIQRMLTLSKMLTMDILRTHMDDQETIAFIVNQLNDMFPTHGYPINYDKAVSLKIQAEMMPDSLNTKCLKFLKVITKISRGGEYEREGVKVEYERPSIIESAGVRTFYYLERRMALDQNKVWTRVGGNGQYMIMAPRKDERGLMRVRAIDSSELW